MPDRPDADADLDPGRRAFLARSIALGAAGLIGPEFVRGDEPTPAPTGPIDATMIVRNRRPLDLETPVGAFDAEFTPNARFFVRSHFGEPAVSLAGPWTIAVRGGVKTPTTFGLDDLARLPQVTIPAVLQCSGNGRAFYRPNIPGVAWERGAVGQAEWSGPRLVDLLDRAGIAPGMAHVHLHGADGPPLPKNPPYLRSLPLDRAIAATTIVATRMNGEPLPVAHGGPARVVVPGWTGNHWIKWINALVVAAEEAPGFYQRTGYKMPNRPGPPGVDPDPTSLRPVTIQNVKSLFARPTAGSVIPPGAVDIRGVAWTGGEATVDRVEVEATIAGRARPWAAARFDGPARPFAWRTWRFPLALDPTADLGPLVLRVRATDSTGATQPESAPWNKSGYLWNGYDTVACEVRRS